MLSFQNKIDSLIESGNSYFDKRSLVESLVEYSRALDLYDIMDRYYKVQKHEILVRCGICYDLLGNTIKAEYYIDKALEIIPNLPFIILYKAVLLLVNGNTEKANILLIKYKQITMGKSELTYETFKLIFYYIMELDHPVLLKEINETAEKFPLNSILLLLRASVNLKLFYTKYPSISSIKEEVMTLNIDNSKITMHDIGIAGTSQVYNKSPTEKEPRSKEEKTALAIKEKDNNYINFKDDVNRINNIESKETAEFLLREGISSESLTKLFFLSIPEMEEVEPKKLSEYKSFFYGFKTFFLLFKSIKLLKASINKRKIKKEYADKILRISNASIDTQTVSNHYDLAKTTNYTTQTPMQSENYNQGSLISLQNNISTKELLLEYQNKIKSIYDGAFMNNLIEDTDCSELSSYIQDISKTLNSENQNHHLPNNNNRTTNIETSKDSLKTKEKIISENLFIKKKYYCHSNINRRLIRYYNNTQKENSLIFKTNQTYSQNSNSRTEKKESRKASKKHNNSNQRDSQKDNNSNNITNMTNTTYNSNNNNSNIMMMNKQDKSNLNEEIKIINRENKRIRIENNQEKVRICLFY